MEVELEKYLFLEELEALQNLELDIPTGQTPVNTGEVFEEIKDIIAGLQQLGLVILSERGGGYFYNLERHLFRLIYTDTLVIAFAVLHLRNIDIYFLIIA